jgi:hypothetical protein
MAENELFFLLKLVFYLNLFYENFCCLSVELGRQHFNTLNKHLRLQIKMSGGSSKSNLQNVSRCSKEFEDNQILIFTAQSFLNLLDHNLFCKMKFSF